MANAKLRTSALLPNAVELPAGSTVGVYIESADGMVTTRELLAETTLPAALSINRIDILDIQGMLGFKVGKLTLVGDAK
jgi:hypothetical protein